jgi:hypothetical protein
MVASALAAMLAGGAAQADVVISSKATANMNCSAGVCSPTAAKAVLNATDLTNMLASGDVKVMTGSGAAKVVVKDAFSWTSTSRLTLDAIQSVEFDRPVTVAGTGAVTITTNDGGSGGDLLFGDKGNLTFWDLSSSLIINGNSYTLVSDIKTLASDIAANPSDFYALANDHDAKHETFPNHVPISTEFLGTFEGLGHTISNLRINRDHIHNEGLFAISDGTLRDINLSKVNVTSSDSENMVGALAGVNRGTVAYATVDGTVSGLAGYLAGLVGDNDQNGIVRNSGTNVAVSGLVGTRAGGLVGLSRVGPGSPLIEDSHATGPVTVQSSGDAGGLVAYGVRILRSYATGSVTVGGQAYAGGLVGLGSDIDQSYATGAVTVGDGSSRAGGLLGNGDGAIVTNSFSTGSVQAGTSAQVGGFAGLVSSARSSYSIGAVSAGSGSAIGGFAGTTGRKGIDDYWDVETSGTSEGCGSASHCTGITGLTTEQLQSGLPAGFDPKIWGQNPNINNGFPYLLANPPPR